MGKINFRTATNDEKETAVLTLMESGITETVLTAVCCAQYAGDQELLETSLAWIFDAIEAAGIEDGNIKAILRYFEYNV